MNKSGIFAKTHTHTAHPELIINQYFQGLMAVPLSPIGPGGPAGPAGPGSPDVPGTRKCHKSHDLQTSYN